MEMDRRALVSIQGIKNKITSQLVLSLPKREGKFRIETNASEYTIGGVLLQE